MFRLGFVIFILSLSGCMMSDEERQKQRQAQYRLDLSHARGECVNFGFKTSDQLFPSCVNTQYNKLIEARNIAFQRRMAAWQAVEDAGRALQGPPETTYKCKKDFGISGTYTCK